MVTVPIPLLKPQRSYLLEMVKNVNENLEIQSENLSEIAFMKLLW